VNFVEHSKMILQLMARNLGIPSHLITEGTKMIEKRKAICYISRSDLIAVLNCQNVRLEGTGVPPDARVANFFIDYTRDMLAVIIEHESFEPVHECCEFPIIGTADIIADDLPPAEAQESSGDLFRRVMRP